jgi:SEC-C motif
MSTSKEIVLPKLDPKRTMKRNEPCWCQSGKKWKNCHRGRDSLSPVNVFETFAEMDEEYAKGYCLHPDAAPSVCSEVVQAHSIQKGGGLAAVAEQNHVLSIKHAGRRLPDNDGAFEPVRLGVNKASTFPGFCGKHDSVLFRAAEHGHFSLNQETAFLLSYRAIAYEYFCKESAIRAYRRIREGDRGRSFEDQCLFQDYVCVSEYGLKLALGDLTELKKRYWRIYKEAAFHEFHFYAVTFTDVIPVVACGAIWPEYDFSGANLQDLRRLSNPIEHVAFNLTSFDGQTIAMFGRLDNGGPAEQLASSFRSVPIEKKANAAVSFAFQYLENTMMRPSWWEALPTRDKHKAVEHFTSGLPTRGQEHNLIAKSSNRPQFVASAVTNELWE